MEDFESQFTESDEEKLRQSVLKNIQALMSSWPDIVAMWSGMVEQCKDAGWTEYAARALVLSQILSDSAYIAAAVPGAIPHEETEE